MARRKVPTCVLRLCRGRLLRAGNAARQPRRPRAHQAAPARARRRIAARPRDHILGEQVSLPLALAPIGLCGMQQGDGEILACRAAQAAGIPFTLSTMSICSIEDVARGGRQAVLVPALRDEGPRLHPRADRARGGGEMQRAGAHARPAGARPAPCDIRNGMTVPPEIKLRNLIDIATKPAWALSVLARQAQDLRQSRRPRAGHGEREFAGAMDRQPVRSGAELEGRRVGQEPVAGQAHPQGHPGCRGRQDRRKDRRERARRLQSRRPPARRRAVLDLGAAEDRRGGRRPRSR